MAKLFNCDSAYICGMPIEEAIKILTFYNTTKVMPTHDYVKGFEDGIKAAYEEVNKQIENSLFNYIGNNSSPDQAADII